MAFGDVDKRGELAPSMLLSSLESSVSYVGGGAIAVCSISSPPFGYLRDPGYVDLDAPNPSGKDLWDTRLVPAASIQSSGSSGSKKSKKARNPNRPGKEYADAA